MRASTIEDRQPGSRYTRWVLDTHSSLGSVGAVVVVAALAIGGVALLAPLIAPYGGREIVSVPMQPPSAGHLLGTDEIGRDVLSRLLLGLRTTLLVGLGASSIAFLLGVPLGIASGFFGGKMDAVMMRFFDAMLAFPGIVLAMALVAVLGPSLTNATVAIGLVQAPRFARIVRGVTLTYANREFVQSAKISGASWRYQMGVSIFPNLLPVLGVQSALVFANAILAEAALAFLGLGVQPPTPSWGAMLQTSRFLISRNWAYFSATAIALSGVVVVMTLLNDTFERVRADRW